MKALNIFEVALLVGGVVFLSALLFANVIARELGHSFVFGEELTVLIMILISFFGMSYAARKGRHIRMAAIYDLLSDKNKKKFVYIISTGSALLMFFLMYEAIKYTLDVASSKRITAALLWPYWTFVVWSAVGFLLTGIQYVRTIVKNVKENETWLSPEEKSEYE